MVILPDKRKFRDLTEDEIKAIDFLRNSGVSVMINFRLEMNKGTEITPIGETYSVCDNEITLLGTGTNFRIK